MQYRLKSFVGSLAVCACALLPAQVGAQEIEGGIVVARDVPTRHAFLPGSGEPLVVNTAPFLEVWGGINPGIPVTDRDAEAMIGGVDNRLLASRELGQLERIRPDSAGLNAAGLDRGSSVNSGIGGIVGQALDSGLGALQLGLGEMQSAVSGGG